MVHSEMDVTDYLISECPYGWTSLTIELRSHHYLSQTLEWCISNVGVNRWKFNWTDFYFRDPKDATMFTLRWS